MSASEMAHHNPKAGASMVILAFMLNSNPQSHWDALVRAVGPDQAEVLLRDEARGTDGTVDVEKLLDAVR